MKSKVLKNKTNNGIKKLSYEVILLKIAYILLGITSSKGVIFGNYYPFGVSLAAAIPEKYAVLTFVGIIIGYFSSSGLSKGLWYISLIAAIGCIRWTLNEVSKIKEHSAYVPLVCFVPTFTIGMIMNYSEPSGISYIFVSLIEALVATSCAYFFKATFETLKLYHGKLHITRAQFVCVLISLFTLVLSISTITIGKISIGRVVAIIVIILNSYFMGVYGGSITGTSAGAIFAISSFGLQYIFGVYAFGGMISGVFSKVGRFAVCGTFLLCSLVYLFQFLTSQMAIICIYEIVCGVVIFALIPRQALHKIREIFYNKIFSSKDLLVNNHEYDREVTEEEYVFEALKSISSTAGSIVNKIVYVLNGELKQECMGAIYKHCKKCNLNLLCWDQNDKSTSEYFQSAITKVLRGVNVESCIEDCSFKYRCNNIKELIEDVALKRDNYIAEVEAEDRAKNLSDGILEKSAWVKSLADYASDKMLMQREDINKSERINRVLNKYGIRYLKSKCKINKGGRIFIEVEMDKKEYTNLFGNKLLKKLSSVCDRQMPEAIVIDTLDRVLVRITEKVSFSVNMYLSQHVCDDGELCGDCCKCFYDGLGNFLAIISDGMGTGGKAAVDGTFTSELIEKLIKLQATTKNALNIANLSILGKSKDESLTAVDILMFDLFQGRAEFIKAGAPITLVYSDGKITKVNSVSLPIGILNQTNISSYNMDLSPGDWILMMSDGVTDVDGGWVEEEFKNCVNSNPKEISERILNIAIEKRKKIHDDDITVLVVNVIKN